MRHHEIIPTGDQQTGQINRRVVAQINLRQGHWGYGYHNYGDPWKEQRYAGD
jgi:hypothetical protein